METETKKRLQTEIETLKNISEPCQCGTTRYSYSKAYKEGVSYVRGVMEDCGLKTREDGVGNLIGTLPGTEPGLSKILSGSHLDTVRCAGAFDGIAGVLCAIEAARMVKESGVPLRHTYEALGMIGEEGTRFGKALLGSQFIAGIYGADELDEFVGTEDGKTMRQAMNEYGLSGELDGVSRKDENVKAFLEIHGEQGPVLEQGQKEIGIVDTIVGLSWLVVKVTGQAGHSGTVPMNLRKDAGTGGGHGPGSGLDSDSPGDLTAAGDQLKGRRTGYAVRKKRQTGRELNENRKKNCSAGADLCGGSHHLFCLAPGPEGRE